MIDLVETIFENLKTGEISEKAGVQLLSLLKDHQEENVHKDYAIIGLSAKFPKAENKFEFMNNIRTGRDGISNFPLRRKYDMEEYLDYIGYENPKYLKGGYLNSIDQFDYQFFKLSLKEASLMDPQQRLFLQAAWEAIEDAGYSTGKMAGTKTGVYVGYGEDSYYKRFIENVDYESMGIATAGNIKPVIASRLNFMLDLKGPSMLIDTACSSALVALHLACEAIKNGECDAAIVGGVKMSLSPLKGGVSVGIESPDYRVKAFDDNSNGIVWGEGVGAVFIKSLEQAQKDGDNIYAVIKGSAINNDGKTIGLTAPSTEMQEQVLVTAWENAKINPEQLSYIEAHGTATRLGDPIEISAIERAFRQYTNRKQFCAVGSIKSSIGHLDHVSGVASLISTIMAIKYNYYPSSLHFQRPNHNIGLLESPVYVSSVPDQKYELQHPRICGVSSFGLSGTNCHVVLEEYIESNTYVDQMKEETRIFVLSACTESALKAYVKKYVEYLNSDLFAENPENIDSICFTASTGRDSYNYRLAFGVKDIEELKDKLNYVLSSNFSSLDRKQIYYGYHNIVIHQKDGCTSEHITIEEKAALDREAEILIDKFTADENAADENWMKQLCSLFVKGAGIEWERIYAGLHMKRISLPTYPFEQTRCWPAIPIAPESYDEYFQKMIWRKEEQSQSKTEAMTGEGKTVLIYDGTFRGLELLRKMKEAGKDVYEVIWNDHIEIDDDSVYKISECSQQEISKVLQQIGASRISEIVFLQFQSGKGDVNVDESVVSVHFMRYLCKAIEENAIADDMKLYIVADYVNEVSGQEETIYLGNAALFGFAKIIPMEFLNIRCKCIDVDDNTSADEIMSEMNVSGIVSKAAIRNHERYVEEFDHYNLETVKEDNITIKETGVYFITGGRGNIGLEFAAFLASKGAKNLVLANRSAFPPKEEWSSYIENHGESQTAQIIERLENIERLGTSVECYSLDVADEQELTHALQDMRNKYGRINGIIHSAGLGFGHVGPRITMDETSQFNVEIAPKVRGTWLLDHLTREDKLDFLVLFSSPITIVGGVGVGSYITANAYQSAYAQYRNMCGYYTLAVGWGPWYHTIEKLGDYFVREQQLFCPLSNYRAISCFEKILGKHVGEVIIGQINYDSKLFTLKELLPFSYSKRVGRRIHNNGGESSSKVIQTAKLSEVILVGAPEEQNAEMYRKVAQVWGNIFGTECIQIDDNFYELGGDSVIAVSLVNLLNRELGIQSVVIDVLKYPVFETFVKNIQEKYKLEMEAEDSTVIEPVSEQEYYEVSYGQKQLYIVNHLQKPATNYNEPVVLLLEGALDKEKLQYAFDRLIQRHEILRTSFHLVGNRPMQKVHDLTHLEIGFHVAEHVNIEAIARTYIKVFDLSKAPLLRVHVIDLPSGKYMLFLDMHHIISDGVSTNILVKEFISLYEGVEPAKLRIQFKDYANWQNTLVDSEAMKEQETFWLNQFRKDIPVLDMPLEYVRKKDEVSKSDVVAVRMDKQLSKELKDFAKRSNTTVFVLFLTILNIELHKYTGQEDIIVGTPVSSRNLPELDSVIGYIVNSIAFRNYPKREMSFSEFLEDVNQRTMEAYNYQDYPFELLNEQLRAKGVLENNPLVNVLLVLQKFSSGATEFSGLKVEQQFIDRGYAQFDILMRVHEYEDFYNVECEYALSMFSKESMDLFMKRFLCILRCVISRPDTVIANIDMLDKEEKERMNAFCCNQLKMDASELTPLQMLSAQIEKTPGKVAVVAGKEQITYEELNVRSNKLAVKLEKQGVEPGENVGILVKNPIDRVISMVSALKAGAVFCVLDETLDSQQLRGKIRELKPCAVMVSDEMSESLPERVNVFNLEHEDEMGLEENMERQSWEEEFAYITYSLDQFNHAKGVYISNASLAYQMKALKDEIFYQQDMKHVCTAQTGQGISICELFTVLASGGCYYAVTSECIQQASEWTQFIEENAITSLTVSWEQLGYYISYLEHNQKQLEFDILLITGFTGTQKLYERMNQVFKFKALYYAGVLTDTNMYATIYKDTNQWNNERMPLGRPIGNHRIEIINDQSECVSMYIPGEIFLSGPSVPEKYLEETQVWEKDNAEDIAKSRNKMYPTKTMARWMPDGTIQYLGRKENRLEIHGVKIQLEEIKITLLSYPNIDAAEIVQYDVEGKTVLYAYLVSEAGYEEMELKTYLMEQLPEYMIPEYFIVLDVPPFLLSEHIDRVQPPAFKKEEKAQFIPEGAVIQILKEIWASVLESGDKDIPTNKTFFEAGGTSLSIVLLHKKLQERFNMQFSIDVLFSYPSIDMFAEYMLRKNKSECKIQPITLPEEYFSTDEYGQKRRCLEFKVMGEKKQKLEQIAGGKQAELRDIFIQVLGYLFGEVSGLNEVVLPVIADGEKKRIRSITIDTANSESLVISPLGGWEFEHGTSWTDFVPVQGNNTGTEKNSVSVSYVIGDSSLARWNYSEQFDFIFYEQSQPDCVIFTVDYTERLANEVIQEFIRIYINCLDIVIEDWLHD